jgi:mannitol-specific phosphotransferase system IIBC component
LKLADDEEEIKHGSSSSSSRKKEEENEKQNKKKRQRVSAYRCFAVVQPDAAGESLLRQESHL